MDALRSQVHMAATGAGTDDHGFDIVEKTGGADKVLSGLAPDV